MPQRDGSNVIIIPTDKSGNGSILVEKNELSLTSRDDWSKGGIYYLDTANFGSLMAPEVKIEQECVQDGT